MVVGASVTAVGASVTAVGGSVTAVGVSVTAATGDWVGASDVVASVDEMVGSTNCFWVGLDVVGVRVGELVDRSMAMVTGAGLGGLVGSAVGLDVLIGFG